VPVLSIKIPPSAPTLFVHLSHRPRAQRSVNMDTYDTGVALCTHRQTPESTGALADIHTLASNAAAYTRAAFEALADKFSYDIFMDAAKEELRKAYARITASTYLPVKLLSQATDSVYAVTKEMIETIDDLSQKIDCIVEFATLGLRACAEQSADLFHYASILTQSLSPSTSLQYLERSADLYLLTDHARHAMDDYAQILERKQYIPRDRGRLAALARVSTKHIVAGILCGVKFPELVGKCPLRGAHTYTNTICTIANMPTTRKYVNLYAAPSVDKMITTENALHLFIDKYHFLHCTRKRY
jgi:hypothetical protein